VSRGRAGVSFDEFILVGVLTVFPRFSTENSQVAIFGIGCVGLSILQGARAKNCSKVIAIDTNSGKKDLALKFGATDFINPTELPEGTTIVDKIVEMTDGGADFTFDATGNVKVMRSALEACHKGWGESVVIGVAPAGAEISTRP
jgi:S-(hydroxymethyl)glutathione dehydrogenase/alcohol dehydrogenase